jgi:DNA relaxase NicK
MAWPMPVVDGGVDYLTCTFKPESKLTQLEFLLARAKARELEKGNFESAWGMAGFTGWRVGGLEFGLRDDGVLVRLSGEVARDWWPKFGKLASNCSRIDLQQTVMVADDWPNTIKTHWQEMVSWWKANPNRPTPSVIAGPSGPQTIYSGKRTSDVFMRVYHRGSKGGLEDRVGHVRYEVELKRDRAKAMLSLLLSTEAPAEVIRSQCYAMLCARGLRLALKYDALPCSHAAPSKSDADKCLSWLRKCVRPSVENLVESGRLKETLAALGLLAHLGQ